MTRTRKRTTRRKLLGGEDIEAVDLGETTAFKNTMAGVNKTRGTAQKFVGAPEVTFPFLMCFVLFLVTALVYSSDDDDKEDHKSFTTYVITLSMMAMNVAAALSFAIFQKNLQDVHLYAFFGMAVASFVFWIYLVYEASQLIK